MVRAVGARDHRKLNPVARNNQDASAVRLADMRRSLTCGVCANLLASSLVLSCGHAFCGACIFNNALNNKTACPTCKMNLHTIEIFREG